MRSAGELTCIAVVNGEDLWVSAQAPDAPQARLGMVHRHSREVRLLPPPTVADLAGQNLPRDTLVATCRSADLLTGQDTGIWDIAVIEHGKSPRRLYVSERAQIYPAPPVGPMARPDGVVLIPYVTKDGRGAVKVRTAPPSVEVTTVVSEPGRLAVTLELCRWTGPAPTSLVLAQRRGEGHLSVPLDITSGSADVTVPLHLLAQQCRDAPASVWDVAVEGPEGRTRCGRTARDVADPRRVHRYTTQTYGSATGDAALVFRPYFTNDRHLAVEIDGTPLSA